jgi:hypothetical protein
MAALASPHERPRSSLTLILWTQFEKLLVLMGLAGSKVSDAEMDAVNLTRHDFHSEMELYGQPKALTPER